MSEKYGLRLEAMEFYGLNTQTFHRWTNNGSIKRRALDEQSNAKYEYILDENLRDEINVMKKHDNRWK